MLATPGSNSPIIRIENFEDKLHSSYKELPKRKLKPKVPRPRKRVSPQRAQASYYTSSQEDEFGHNSNNLASLFNKLLSD